MPKIKQIPRITHPLTHPQSSVTATMKDSRRRLMLSKSNILKGTEIGNVVDSDS